MNLKEQILNTNLSKDECAIWYLGQETMLCKTDNKYILFDPYLSYYVDRVCSDENIKWVRRYDVPIDPKELDFVDFVVISHDHEDHCDPDTLTPFAIANKKAKYIAPPCAKASLNKCGIDDKDIIGAKAGESVTIDCIEFIPMPAAHEELHYDENGDYKELGYFVKANGITLFHSGDMCPYDTIDDYTMDCDICMIAVNGRDEYRLAHGIEGNFNCSEAIDFALKTHSKIMVPLHFDMYDVNSIPYGELADTMEKEKKFTPFHIFMPGERYIYKK